MESNDPYLNHWADQAAAKTLAAHPNAQVITVAAGITPSGVVHVGNFREVMTVDLVARALRDRGAAVRFIYSWDDFDVFRKVPLGMPKPELLAKHLGHSIVDVPDPFDEHDSYASHHIAQFERGLPPLGIRPEFIRQSRRYRAGDYAEGIKKAGTVETEALVKAFEGLEVKGTPAGPITYRAIDHQSTMGIYVGHTAMKDGKGLMVDYSYIPGEKLQPSDEEVAKLRPKQ